MPELKRLGKLKYMDPYAKQAWIAALVKEFKGLIQKGTFAHLKDEASSKLNHVMEVFKCKMDKRGYVDKLKCRKVFQGDLYTPTWDMDSWNPHASWTALMIYLAMCAKLGIFPSQLDFVMA
jgi:hypothetical protein